VGPADRTSIALVESWLSLEWPDFKLRVASLPGPKPAKWRQELSGGVSHCLNLEQEIHHNALKPCILGFEALQWSLVAAFGDLSIRTAFSLPSTLSGHLQAQHIFYPA
jgi:hypothetical protein